MRHRSAAQRHSDMWEKGRGDGYSPHHLLLVLLAQLNTMCTGSIATDDAIGAVYVHASQPHEQRLYHLCNCQTHSIPARVVLGSSATAAATTPNSSFLHSSFQPAGCIATHAEHNSCLCPCVCAVSTGAAHTVCWQRAHPATRDVLRMDRVVACCHAKRRMLADSNSCHLQPTKHPPAAQSTGNSIPQ